SEPAAARKCGCVVLLPTVAFEMTVYSWSVDVWNPEDCHCGDSSPPPTFQVPPPPPHPPQYPGTAAEGKENIEVNFTQQCEEEFSATCSAAALAPELRDTILPAVMIHVPLFLVITATLVLVILIIITTCVIYRLRHCFLTPKGCPHAPSVRINGDLSSSKHSCLSRKSQRLRPPRKSILGIPVSLQLCPSNYSQHHHNHFYQSISSGSDTCSYTTSEATACHEQVHRIMPHMYRHTGTDSEEENMQLHSSPSAQPKPRTNAKPSFQPIKSTSILHHDYSNLPLVKRASTNFLQANFNPNNVLSQSSPITPGAHLVLPCASCGLFLPSNLPINSPLHSHSNFSSTPLTSGRRKNSYYMNDHHTEGSSPSPQERGLPPLPSRSPRFKAYFFPDWYHTNFQQKDKRAKLDRQQKGKTCQCNQNFNKNALEKSSQYIFNHECKGSSKGSNPITFDGNKHQDSNERKIKDSSYTGSNND
ncbi:unnamed protein product, partial [Meganyctiphanes norvegica]